MKMAKNGGRALKKQVQLGYMRRPEDRKARQEREGVFEGPGGTVESPWVVGILEESGSVGQTCSGSQPGKSQKRLLKKREAVVLWVNNHGSLHCKGGKRETNGEKLNVDSTG